MRGDDTRAGDGDGGDGDDGAAAEREDARRRMRSALREVRREGWKAALLHAAADATAVLLAANLLLLALDPAWLPARVPVPGSVTERVGPVLGRRLGTPAVPGTATVAAGAGVLAFVVEVWLRVRRPLVERFEAANPAVAESLRTARDAVADGADSAMAARLYEDVLERLRETSGVALLDTRRLALTLVVVVALSLGTVQVAVADLALLDRRPGQSADGPPDARQSNYTGLQDGDSVLGDAEDVQAGSENLTAGVESTGGSEQVEDAPQFPSESGAGGGGGAGGGVDSQQAGFAPPDQVEDAELVREYNRRIREDEDDE